MDKRLISFLAGCAALCASAAPAAAQASRFGATNPAILAPSRGSAVAFGNGVYLVVSAMGTVNGRFVGADGIPLGSQFTIQTSASYGAFPRVAYSPHADAGLGAFLVTWGESNVPDQVHARLVSYIKGGPLGADVIVGLAPTGEPDSWVAPFSESGRAIAYSTVSREFLVVWENKARQLIAFRLNNSAQVIGAVSIPNHNDGERDPNVAYNPDDDQFLIMYTGWGDGAFAAVRRVQAGTGVVIDQTKILLGRNGGTYITDVSYNRVTRQYLAAWYALPDAVVYGRLVNRDGTLGGDVTTLSTRWTAYDALGLASNPLSGTSFMVSHSSNAEDGGVEIRSDGIPVDNGFLVTAAGGTGNFYPKIAASSATTDWLVSTANSFTTTVVQLVHTATTGAPAPPPPPPPPPPTPVVPFPDPSSSDFATGGSVDLLWQHTDGSLASWRLSGPNFASGTALNPARVNDPKWHVAATGDFNMDGKRDIVFQHDAGWLAVWLMNGATLVEGRALTPNRVGDAEWRVVGAADVNGDGSTDLLFRHRTQGWVAGWLMNGTVMQSATLMSPSRVPDLGWKIAAVGDVNGDTRPDIIWQHDSGLVTSWLMDGLTMVGSGIFTPNQLGDAGWKIKAIGDINGDGKPDLLWQHAAYNWLGATILDGTTVIDSVFLSPGQVNAGWSIVGPR